MADRWQEPQSRRVLGGHGTTILVASDHVSAILIAEHPEALAPQFTFVRQSEKLLRTLTNKRNLSHLCQRLGVPSPHMVSPQTREELLDVSGDLQYPIIVKAAEP